MTQTADTLTAAYHALFDVRDAHAGANFLVKRQLWAAQNELAQAMRMLGVEVPERFDAE